NVVGIRFLLGGLYLGLGHGRCLVFCLLLLGVLLLGFVVGLLRLALLGECHLHSAQQLRPFRSPFAPSHGSVVPAFAVESKLAAARYRRANASRQRPDSYTVKAGEGFFNRDRKSRALPAAGADWWRTQRRSLAREGVWRRRLRTAVCDQTVLARADG